MSKMLSISVDPESAVPHKNPGDMAVGDIALAWGECAPHYVLRTYNGLVDLHNPMSTWDTPEALRDWRVEILPPGVKLTLMVQS